MPILLSRRDPSSKMGDALPQFLEYQASESNITGLSFFSALLLVSVDTILSHI